MISIIQLAINKINNNDKKVLLYRNLLCDQLMNNKNIIIDKYLISYYKYCKKYKNIFEMKKYYYNMCFISIVVNIYLKQINQEQIEYNNYDYKDIEQFLSCNSF